jgi:hypothetical protein
MLPNVGLIIKQIFKTTFDGLGRTQRQNIYSACVKLFLLPSVMLKELEPFAQVLCEQRSEESKTPSMQIPEEEEQEIQEEKQMCAKALKT